MGIIEQAAKRLEELRRAGIESDTGGSVKFTAGEAKRHGLPERTMRTLETFPVSRDAAGANHAGTEQVHPTGPHSATARRSREVTLDLARLAADGFVTSDGVRTRLADEFRVIKRPLLANVHGAGAAPVERANLIMVTSALPGEGKTFTSINLALSMAMEVDSTVLLVDADVARPTVLERLGLQAPKGLLDLLASRDLDVADVLLRTNIDRLSILPAGQPHSRATELLASDSMNRLVDDLANRYPDRVLIFDAPPLLPSTESRVLASHMGQVVVVVEADRTSQGALTQAMATIENCPVVMTVLNKVRHSKVGSYYGYYGGYGN